LRVTRNCPWNKCEFCPVYKGAKFSKRSVEEVKEDIRAMAWWTEKAVGESCTLGYGGKLDERSIPAVYSRYQGISYMHSILVWMTGGGKTSFLQDADNLILKTEDLTEILLTLRETFPQLERVTTYSRSRTVAKKSAEELKTIHEAGLNRVHIGMESGSDKVLEKVKKGVTQKQHIEAGKMVREAGMELSEYIMPGLGGKELSDEHARETAKALSAINPHFIRIRSLGIREGIILYDRYREGEFEPMNDIENAHELRKTIEHLDGIDSRIVSDHILNLLPEVEGKLPGDKERILAVIDRFLNLPEEDRLTYVVGRRFGLFEGIRDLADPSRSAAARQALDKLREEGDDVHTTIRETVSRFI